VALPGSDQGGAALAFCLLYPQDPSEILSLRARTALSRAPFRAGYNNVRRFQLGIPVWRALGSITEVELEGVRYVAG
jgi:hypothetical protein